MNREIKFRGKSKCSGKWLYGDIMTPSTFLGKYRMWYENYKREVDPGTIGQYTGLTDKNGKEIYEGDILYQEQTLLGVVCISARYGISIQTKETTWALRNFIFDSDFDTGMLSDIEVRGNIHDNPELLKQQRQ